MPKELRKRGKKKSKKPHEDAQPDRHEPTQEPEEAAAGPSWILPAAKTDEELNTEAPFGYVDADVKAYFRTVDAQLREWQETVDSNLDGEDDSVNSSDARRMFFIAALSEMAGKEKQLATDPDCSVILERMCYSMDDFTRRVFADSLSGSYIVLSKHRHASHVCQTLLLVAGDTVSRECRGIIPSPPEGANYGELRTMSELVRDISNELVALLSDLTLDPFASHVIRALLILLCPPQASGSSTGHDRKSLLRSRKSAAFKTKQGKMKSVFSEAADAVVLSEKQLPESFAQLSKLFVETAKGTQNENETRALAANSTASPVLQMLLEVEAQLNMSDTPDSLMDRVLVGVISACKTNPDTPVIHSDYLSTLLRDPTASHLLETLVSRSPPEAFEVLRRTYFMGKLPRLAVHPVSNFVVAKVVDRADATQVGEILDEMEGVWTKVIGLSRTGVLKSLADRCASLHSHEDKVVEAVRTAFGITSEEDNNMLVSCIMVLKTLEEFKSLKSSKDESEPSADIKSVASKVRGGHGKPEDPLEPKIQGALILQSLLRLSAPHNSIFLDSIKALPIMDIITFSHNPSSSRVFDVVFESTTVPYKYKRDFVLQFIGHYHTLVDDRIGSRVGDRCWAFADPYLKEKIARSLIPYEQNLVGSYFGKFFARNLNLYLLQKKPDQWRDMQATKKAPPVAQLKAAQNDQIASEVKEGTIMEKETSNSKRKRGDDIDVLFDTALGKKIKKGVLGEGDKAIGHSPSISVDTEAEEGKGKKSKEKSNAMGLNDVLGAIKAAPKDKQHPRKKTHR